MAKKAKEKALEVRGVRGDRRDDIISAARRLFAAKGYEATTMAEIAASLELAEGTVYLYFDNKRMLVTAVAIAWFGDIVDQTEREAEAIAALPARLQFLIRSHLEMILAHPSMYLLFIREVRASPTYESSGGRALNRRYTDLLRPCIDGAKPTPGLDFPVARDMVYGGVEHVAWSAIVRKETAPARIQQLSADLATAYGRALGLA
ncbi:TetR/AcrR family transcriptional regulator [Variovorax boronicumulans]|uniref:TetR/AcrR family transcriptional regulator n=1 Tax=Variovorax boronicumulans TaxID=436515 RepID=UPI001C59A89C